jgi:radical SAM superfamily enzyme YgiQ (UPF0313 family)
MNKIFCISAGQLIVKKKDNKISRKNRYLNYGLLSLATKLKENGYNPIQIHGNFSKPIDIFNNCKELGLIHSKNPLLISIPSFYAISWVNEFIYLLKEEINTVKIILGGRWVIGERIDLMKKLVPQADMIISGLADSTIINIVKSLIYRIPKNLTDIKRKEYVYPYLDYSLLFERNLYHPSIEVSRGCGMGCSFCQEKDEKLNPLKKPKTIIDEIKSTIISDNLPDMNLYFEASMLIPNKRWINGLCEYKERSEINFKWRSEGRVDAINPKYIPALAKSGLKVLDLGLESASHGQLLRMHKTRNPEKYLLRASKLVKTAYDFGIYIKINVLLTAGETNETISETVDWLNKHKKYIKGVSVGPVIAFGWEDDINGYIEQLSKYGTTFSHSPATGIAHLNLSDEINYEKSISISNQLSQEFMTAKDYFDLKSFSYFSRDYLYHDFLNDISIESNSYSFNSKKH